MNRPFRFGMMPTLLHAPDPTGGAAVADPPPAPAAVVPPAAPAPTPPATALASEVPPAAAVPAPTPPAEPAPPSGAPEKYALTLPDGGLFTAEMLPVIEAEARALNLTNEAAQGLLNTRIDSAKALGERYLVDAKADSDIGGAKFDESVAFARKGRDWLFPADSKGSGIVRQFFDATGLGNHPELIRAFARIGRGLKEDSPNVNGGPAPKNAERLADQMYPSTRAKSASA